MSFHCSVGPGLGAFGLGFNLKYIKEWYWRSDQNIISMPKLLNTVQTSIIKSNQPQLTCDAHTIPYGTRIIILLFNYIYSDLIFHTMHLIGLMSARSEFNGWDVLLLYIYCCCFLKTYIKLGWRLNHSWELSLIILITALETPACMHVCACSMHLQYILS